MAGDKMVTLNRKALHDYEILERVEAGLVLTGTEIKSIRAGRVDIREGYVKPQGKELWLINAHISTYPAGGIYNHEPTRPRKLLLHRDQMANLAAEAAQKGLTIVALKLYIRNHVAKVELGLARGKKLHDKRRAIIDRDREREARRALQRRV
jgi:SsrA-binding protein